MRHRSIAMLCLVIATSVGAQPAPPSQYHATVNTVSWWANTSAMYATSGSTLTIQLPAASQITANVFAELRATFDVSMGRYHVMLPVSSNMPNLLTCYEIAAGWIPSGTTQRTTKCHLTVAQARTITQDQTMTVSVGTPQGTKNLTLVVKPYTGPNYVASSTVTTVGHRPNDLITFRVKLMSPASQPQEVAWGLSPANCFVADSPGTIYSQTWTLSQPNVARFNAGEQQRDLTVRIATLKSCVGANRKLELWSPTTTSVMQAPTYTTTYFTVSEPK